MPITEKTSKIIWGQCAARCSICREELIHTESEKVAALVGEVAHIVGESEKAARGISELTTEERNEPENLLLLCRNHHKIIDDCPDKYSVANLIKIKEEHITWISSHLAKLSPWRSNLSQLIYINIPRLCEQSELQGYKVDLSHYKENQTLHSLGWELNHVMSSFQKVLPNLSIDAVPIDSLSLHEGHIGSHFSFDRHRFRTKNIKPVGRMQESASFELFSEDLSKSPHIYTRIEEFRLIMFINPNWITTSTAFMLFRPSSGQSTLSGLGRITNVDYDTKIILATPWIIGLPKGPFEYIFNKQTTEEPAVSNSNSSLDVLVDMERALKNPVYFSPPPEVCDLCRRYLDHDKYMIDGIVRRKGIWACMCAKCFATHGQEIAYGSGQLYMRVENGWLEVAGFSPEEAEDENF